MSTIFAVLDTNIFLHFQPFDQIKWAKVLGGRPVTLVVPAVVVRELDRAKDSHPRRGIQDCARSALEKIKKSELGNDDFKMPDDVELAFKEEASISFENYSLKESVEDDSILGSCVELQKEHPNAQIVLVTDDTTPQLKAARRDIETKEPPEKYRLPSARGELEKENRKLKQKIQKIENRLPKLDLVFQNGKKYWNNTIDPPSSMLTEEEINERLAELREEYPPKDPPSTEDPSGRANTVSQMIKQLQQMPEFTPPSTSVPNVSSPEIEEVSSYRASFHVQRLKHDREVSFDSLYVVYPSIEDAFSFEVDYQIHSASLPEEETGELQVVVQN